MVTVARFGDGWKLLTVVRTPAVGGKSGAFFR
jgi:hypothetical protein